MKKFVTTTYKITTDKIKRHPLRFVMISDLHNVVFGKKNEPVFDRIKSLAPDAILIAGDLVLGKSDASLKPAAAFLSEAVKLAPVLYGPGNHEQRMKLFTEDYGGRFSAFEKKIKQMGVTYLENERMVLKINGETVAVTGLDLLYEYYERGPVKGPDRTELEGLIGRPDKQVYEILLAHTPRYGDAYFAWGADLILSGHYHGGIVRLPFLGSIISPDLRLFPRYGYGEYRKRDGASPKKAGRRQPITGREQIMITGAGLGEHTLPLRINNPRELIVLECLPKEV